MAVAHERQSASQGQREQHAAHVGVVRVDHAREGDLIALRGQPHQPGRDLRRAAGHGHHRPIDARDAGSDSSGGSCAESTSGVGSPAQALELAPQALTRTALPTNQPDRGPGLCHNGRAVVHVAGRGDGGPDTRLDRPHDLDDSLAISDARLNPIARANLRRRLRRRSIHDDVAAFAQPGRKRASLHEAHRAQPAIDPCLVGSAGISHAVQDGTGREGVATIGARSGTGEFRTNVRRIGRGERDSPATNDLPITMRLAEPPEPFDWLRSA